MTVFYITTAANHPGGSGYWEVVARDREEARAKAFERLGARWSFDYASLDEVHPLDRKCHGRIS